ncbi:hypothetical protein QOV31_002708 [Agrobacterium fabrum]|jgi:hypothetical protein|nr:hypothetical protein [Agrobacterium fabrum]CAD0209425.1 hypothetical protein AGTUEHA105_LOCUS2218 [Agrobacterium tumefaciens]WJK75825.1 hypothetical protein QOV31_002708 [Agrobacterium fabrum]CAH0230046.1 hypothetical protein SRABI46_02705 [Agrobacterium fabrum]CAH0243102.1 hypothetical protein SRABI05_02788 [Agrobacterium fabrum]
MMENTEVPTHGAMRLPDIRSLHRPYASMNWIRFNGSLRMKAESQPLDGTPLVNGHSKRHCPPFVKAAHQRLAKVRE